MNKRVGILMKRLWLCALLCTLMLLCACGQKNEETYESGESVCIEHSSYYYDQGYLKAGGWMYDMTIASEKQLREINDLTNALVLEWTGEDFLLAQGYRLIWRDAAGNQMKEILVIDENTVSMEGLLYDVPNAQALYNWLEALRIDEQSVG